MSSPLHTDQAEGIAIIGLAGRFPGAPNVEQFWKNLCHGVESVRVLTDEELNAAGVDPQLLRDPNYVKAGVLLEGIEMFDARFFGFTPREAELIDPQHRIFLECAWEALEDSGYVPDHTPLRVGVYAGAGVNNYLLHNLFSNPELLQSMNYLQRMMTADKDYLATRVSYKLDLKGPSFSVQTACSTSLVAVHLACQSLLNGECDMALAGGVSIRIPQTAGYLYEQGSTLSPDGHCRAFDAEAKGMVTGSGAGIVVLKRMADALDDGDCIRAVIRSSSINNDGSAKVGFTAPSVDGQATVISEAHALAGITADQIGYVETHGTGTPLGDPIEIAGLTKAFLRTTAKSCFCPIGSVKTNIGHLDAASGVAGLIKVVMALQNRRLPASLNFQQPNPVIDFTTSPFYVQQKESEWSSAGPRLAGVSSFGIGGTNAHVVVQEAPPVFETDASRSWQLLTLSAKSTPALEAATDRLTDFLRQNRTLNLADVAFTLQQGRKPFAHRRAMAVNSIDDAIKTIETRASSRVSNAKVFDGDVSVVFMFPAQGAQHVNMGRGLYETESVFRESVDLCAEHLQPLLGLDLRSLLYPNDHALEEEASEQLRQTQFTQPAVFVINYALAQLWMSWGIKPAAVIGHSLGEYVAATLAGVFDLKDALALVTERARLMQGLPAGKMLAVPLSEEQLLPWLREGVSLAGVNAPSMSVISGPSDSIDQLAREFQAKQVEVQTLRTSHAFHSAMMDPILAPLVNRIAQVSRSAPRIPFMSTLTGTWITATEASDPAYWGRQTRHAVRFSPAIQELLQMPGRILLEVGPGNTLSSLAKLNLRPGAAATVVNSMPHVKEERSDQECMVTALGRLWTAGAPIDWSRLYGNEHRRRVPLPTYPFERKKFWIEPRTVSASLVPSEQRDEKEESSPASSAAHGDDALYARPELATAFTAPATETEKTLAKLWQHVLGVQVGIHDDFFELGGHSLLAVTLMGAVERSFGKRLPLASLIQAPTIHQFAPLLGAEESTPSWSSLVALNEIGNESPLFLMHSHGGNVLEYEPLVHRLGHERPVYALQARGLDGDIADDLHIEEMASYYLREIRSVQPHGPYYLGGFCFGGFLALEAAHQLRAQGEAVSVVAMINSSTKEYPTYPARASRMRRGIYKLAYRLALEMDNASGKGARDLFNHILGRARRVKEIGQAKAETLLGSVTGKFGHPRMKESITLQLERLAAAHDCAWSIYEPRPYDGKVVLMRAARQPLGIDPDPTLGWGKFLTGELQMIEVPGFRQNMLDEPNVNAVATVLLDVLRAEELVEAPEHVLA